MKLNYKKILLVILLTIYLLTGCKENKNVKYEFEDSDVVLELGRPYVIDAIKEYYRNSVINELSDFDITFSGVVSEDDEKYIELDKLQEKMIDVSVDSKLAFEIGTAALKPSDCCEIMLYSNRFSIAEYSENNFFVVKPYTENTLGHDFWIVVDSKGKVLNMEKHYEN